MAMRTESVKQKRCDLRFAIWSAKILDLLSPTKGVGILTLVWHLEHVGAVPTARLAECVR